MASFLSGKFSKIVMALLLGFVLQGCNQVASSQLAGVEAKPVSVSKPAQIKQDKAAADYEARVAAKRQEVLDWQKAWQDKVAKLEADRKARLNKDEKKAPVVVAKKQAAPKVTGRSRYDALIAKYARAYNVPIRLAHAVVSVESSYRANARGAAGEIGLMQVRLATARGMGYRGSAKALYNPETNIKYGMKYLGKAYQLGGGSTCGAILKYNAGHGAKRMNPTSARYCRRIKKLI